MLDQKTQLHMRSIALENASTAHDDRTKARMIALHVSLRTFLGGKKRLTEAMVEFQLAEQWSERQGSERQKASARESITECGKALAEGP
ncbi:hypothetical protein [Arthrobacter sp. 18067]|uniref:hypothetical protein n=1 Tax=Arthrobacter sp. 18067 TaxID=2681413 RepID=UPI001F38B0DA|nr:hypothetical protein [Arthrobacter sp. 18067]